MFTQTQTKLLLNQTIAHLTMADITLPDPPIQLKPIHCYMKVASDIERVDPVVAYWVRLFATETGFKIDKDSKESKAFLGSIIMWLEKFKTSHKDNEAVNNTTVGQAHVENFVVALFTKADTLDRAGTANKSTVRMFYMASLLFEAMAAFGPLTDDIKEKAKYAKFKAAYIQKCLKMGQVPKPGPLDGADLQMPSDEGDDQKQPESSSDSAGPMPQVPSAGANNSSQEPFILTPSQVSFPTNPALLPQPPAPATCSLDKPTVKLPEVPSQTLNTPANTSAVSTISATRFHAINGAPLNPEDLTKSQKYCKFANSALEYDDIATAVANLEKALKLLTTGQRID